MKELKIKVGFTKTADNLSDAELGRLFRGMLKYASSGEEPTLGGSERILWPSVKEDIDTQLKSFARRSIANTANITKRYESLRTSTNNYDSYKFVEERKAEEKAEETGEKGEKKSFPLEPPLKENTQREEKEGEKEGEKKLPRASNPAAEAFEIFWAVYPKKVGKKVALSAFLKVPASERPLLVPAIERQKQSPQWQRDGGQYIPNPATWLNQGRWLDEGIDDSFRTRPKNKVAQELDDFYQMMKQWGTEGEASEK